MKGSSIRAYASLELKAMRQSLTCVNLLFTNPSLYAPAAGDLPWQAFGQAVEYSVISIFQRADPGLAFKALGSASVMLSENVHELICK